VELLLARKWFSPVATVGELFVAGRHQCFTLEDFVREGEKVPGATAIPTGRYALKVNYSRRFNMVLPILVDVPQFSGVRIHAGNTHEDTSGCILVGKEREPDAIRNSRVALGELLDVLVLPAFITIQNIRGEA
jgi:hypothetical protein